MVAGRTFDTVKPDPETVSGDVMTALIAGIVGSTVGTALGVSLADLRKAQAELSNAAEEVPLQPGLQRGVVKLIREQTTNRISVVTNEVSLPSHDLDSGALASQGFDTVLAIFVFHQNLHGAGRINPPMALEASVHVHLVRAADGALLYAFPLDYRGRAQTFTRWAAHGAKPFRGELEHCRQAFAAAVVHQLFFHLADE